MLTVQNLSFGYHTTPVLKDISFTIEKGQHIALIGASGCGKSTLLKLIYGLLHTDQGTLFWEEHQIRGPHFNLVPGESYMKYLSQGSELLPYRSVAENIGQFLSSSTPELKMQRVSELLDIVEMTSFANIKIEQLSGGQKQRVALARALAKKPALLLLDEPFGNIDNFRRNSLRRNLLRYLKRNHITSITATHDKTDILSFTDETIVIHNGKLIAKENTISLYQNPKQYNIASLFGEINEFEVATFISTYTGTETFLVYPHELKVDTTSTIKARVKHAHFNGNHFLIEAIYKRNIIFVEHHSPIAVNEMIGLTIDSKCIEKRGIIL